MFSASLFHEALLIHDAPLFHNYLIESILLAQSILQIIVVRMLQCVHTQTYTSTSTNTVDELHLCHPLLILEHFRTTAFLLHHHFLISGVVAVPYDDS